MCCSCCNTEPHTAILVHAASNQDLGMERPKRMNVAALRPGGAVELGEFWVYNTSNGGVVWLKIPSHIPIWWSYTRSYNILVDLSNSNGHPGPVTGVLDGLIDTLSSMFDICMAWQILDYTVDNTRRSSPWQCAGTYDCLEVDSHLNRRVTTPSNVTTFTMSRFNMILPQSFLL